MCGRSLPPHFFWDGEWYGYVCHTDQPSLVGREIDTLEPFVTQGLQGQGAADLYFDRHRRSWLVVDDGLVQYETCSPEIAEQLRYRSYQRSRTETELLDVLSRIQTEEEMTGSIKQALNRMRMPDHVCSQCDPPVEFKSLNRHVAWRRHMTENHIKKHVRGRVDLPYNCLPNCVGRKPVTVV